MSSQHLVDPDLLPLLELLPNIELSAETLPLARLGALPLPQEPHGPVELLELQVPGSPNAPPVPLRLYSPAERQEPLTTILHLHGGGYVMGATAPWEGVHRRLVHDLQCILVSVDYRLAPETIFPGAVEDAYAALCWVKSEGSNLGIDTSHVGLMGESAGGGLAAGLALLARDRGEHAVAFQHLIYPMIDDRTGSTDEGHPYTGEFVWNAASNRFGWASLLGHAPGGSTVSPYAAAARATDLAGLPPTFISVGALDLFVDENIEYTRRLARAGVPVELHVYPGAFHGFDLMQNAVIAETARRDSLAALRRALRSHQTF